MMAHSTTEPLIPGESAYDRKMRLQLDYRLTHAAEIKAYRAKCRLEMVRLRLAANPLGHRTYKKKKTSESARDREMQLQRDYILTHVPVLAAGKFS